MVWKEIVLGGRDSFSATTLRCFDGKEALQQKWVQIFRLQKNIILKDSLNQLASVTEVMHCVSEWNGKSIALISLCQEKVKLDCDTLPVVLWMIYKHHLTEHPVSVGAPYSSDSGVVKQ